eukprot:3696384-Rhodomonas_salina.1
MLLAPFSVASYCAGTDAALCCYQALAAKRRHDVSHAERYRRRKGASVSYTHLRAHETEADL